VSYTALAFLRFLEIFPDTTRQFGFCRVKPAYLGSYSTSLLEVLVPCGGVPELLASKGMTLVDSKSMFLTTCE
jgi:hypothetical protein